MEFFENFNNNQLVAVYFEATPLYNKIILGPATSKEVPKVTNKHMLQQQKNVLED